MGETKHDNWGKEKIFKSAGE